MLAYRIRSRAARAINQAVRFSVESLESRTLLTAGGAFDSSFGSGGFVVDTLGSPGSRATDVLLASGGKLIVGGETGGGQGFVARFNANGALDTTFGTGGKTVFFNLNPEPKTPAVRLALQSDGKIVFGGSLNGNFQIGRLNSNGTIDSGFGVGGFRSVDFGASNEQITGLAIQSSGAIVAGGFVGSTTTHDFALTRLTSGGAIDSGFGTSGKTRVDFGADDQARDLALDGSGNIYLAGFSAVSAPGSFLGFVYSAVLAGFDANGHSRTNFGNDSRGAAILTDTNSVVWNAVVVAGNRVIVGGWEAFGLSRMGILTYSTSTGTLSTGPSEFIPPEFPGDAFCTDLSLSPDGTYITYVGFKSASLEGNYLVGQITLNNFNLPFGSNIQVMISPPGTPFVSALTQPDGRVVIVGGRGDSPAGVYLARLLPTTYEISGSVSNRDSNIPPLTNVQIYIDANNNKALDPGEVTQFLGGGGSYKFDGLLAGTYTVRLVTPGARANLLDPFGNPNNPPVDFVTVSLGGAVFAQQANFIYTTSTYFDGQFFADYNGNGRIDNGDDSFVNGLAYVDLNKNGVFDAGEPSSHITSSPWRYAFALPAGSYQVRAVVPAGFKVVAPSGGKYDLTFGPGEVITGKNFGVQPPPPQSLLSPDGTLTIDGTNQRDVIALRHSVNSLVVEFNGVKIFEPYASVKKVVINGNEGNDEIRGTPSSNAPLVGISLQFNGGAGDDWLVGADKADSLNGGDGNDTLEGYGGDDDLQGGEGRDLATYRNYRAGVKTSLDNAANDGLPGEHANVHTDIELLEGSGYNDTLTGGGNADWINGGAGNDKITGKAGNETILGDFGNDTIIGGAGADSMDGGNGMDTIDYRGSSAGVQVIEDVFANDGAVGEGDRETNFETIYGSNFNDTLFGSSWNELIIGGDGDDSIRGGDGSDTIQAGNGKDSISGGDGDDHIDGGLGADIINGDAGTDIAFYTTRTNPVKLSLDNVANDGEVGENDQIGNSVEQIRGGEGADLLVGNDGINTLYGGGGNDTLIALGGKDALFGEGGDDSMDGGLGNDFMRGGDGTADIVTYESRTNGVNVTLDDVANDGETNEGDNVTSDTEIVNGGSSADSITGSAADNVLRGNNGNDTLTGGAGHDQLFGGNNNDTLFARDGISDTLDGGSGNDSAQIDNGIDVILNNSVETFLV